MEKDQYVFTKLDNRHLGSGVFSYLVKPVKYKPISSPIHHISFRNSMADEIKSFNQLRNWCITTWGPSCEIEDYLHIILSNKTDYIDMLNKDWAWVTHPKLGKRYILLTEPAKSWMELML